MDYKIKEYNLKLLEVLVTHALIAHERPEKVEVVLLKFIIYNSTHIHSLHE